MSDPDLFAEPGLTSVLASNPGPFTLDGTRTWIVGRTHAAIIDPGPDDAAHLDAVAARVAGAETVVILLTHGHRDHAAGASSLSGRLGAPVAGAGGDARPMADREEVETDAGRLVAVATPGHTPDHLGFHWPERAAFFAGDLVLGHGDTTLVAGYPGCVADYLASLRLLRALGPRRIYPTHGPPIDDVQDRLLHFERHRQARVEQVRAVLAENPEASRPDLVARVWGASVPPGLEGAALASLDAILDHLGRATVG